MVGHGTDDTGMGDGVCCSAIDAPGGFLFEWWSVFWDIFIARTNEKHSEVAASYIEVRVGVVVGWHGRGVGGRLASVVWGRC